ncbi:hypothetical protein LV779_04655 [Streptomyces thinghirensis]|nr:hypothetical protein [Streptomyces thinghirensis]
MDDLDALVTPRSARPRPAVGSVMRALEAVAREGERLGVHLVAATGPGGRTEQTEPARRAALRVTLEAPVPGPDEPAPGRGRLAPPRGVPGVPGRAAGFPGAASRRTAHPAAPPSSPGGGTACSDPPTRRPVRELGNGPTDPALLASALERDRARGVGGGGAVAVARRRADTAPSTAPPGVPTWSRCGRRSPA